MNRRWLSLGIVAVALMGCSGDDTAGGDAGFDSGSGGGGTDAGTAGSGDGSVGDAGDTADGGTGAYWEVTLDGQPTVSGTSVLRVGAAPTMFQFAGAGASVVFVIEELSLGETGTFNMEVSTTLLTGFVGATYCADTGDSGGFPTTVTLQENTERRLVGNMQLESLPCDMPAGTVDGAGRFKVTFP